MRWIMPTTAVILALVTWAVTAQAQEGKAEKKTNRPADGVYAVLRDSQKKKNVLPLKEGEALVVHYSRYLKATEKETPRHVVVRTVPDVQLDLDGVPRLERRGKDDLRILLKLRPKAAEALKRLTADPAGKQVAIVIGGELVTMHKVREAITTGQVQITSCAPGGAEYLLRQLRATSVTK